jgi:hypothetical protein
VGKVQNEKFWIDYAQKVQEDPRIKIMGWIDCDTPGYKDILNTASFMVFPSFAEGQPGTVIEALEGGCIPLLTEEAGFDYYPLGKYIRGDTSIWNRAYNISNDEFHVLQFNGLSLLENKYDNEVFKNTIKREISKLCQE